MTPPGITIRSAVPEDAPAIRTLVQTSFGATYTAAEYERVPRLFPPREAIVAVAEGQIVGHVQSTTMTVTVPGEAAVEACGIAGVCVAPTHRRRGILRAMYVEQHRRIEASGLPLAMFTASDGGLYGRFGYGPATWENAVEIDRRFAEFLPSAPDPGGVRLREPTAVRAELAAIYDRWRGLTPAAQLRPEAVWEGLLDGLPDTTGEGELFALLHADGYALYRFHSEGRVKRAVVTELRAITAEAHAALWRALLGLDLTQSVRARLTDHDPLRYLLTNPRLVRTAGRFDGMWARLIDVPAALSSRSYASDLDIVLEVRDPFRAAGGRFALRARGGQATCAPTGRAAQVELGIDVLASMYFGAHPARVFAAADRLRAAAPGDVRALDHAFLGERDAELGWFF